MHDAQHAEVTAEYQRAGGIWDTSQVTTMHEVHDAALQAKEPQNKAERLNKQSPVYHGWQIRFALN